MKTTEAQNNLKQFFSDIFGNDNVFKEWPSSRNANDWLRRSGDDIPIYTPRPDIAVGPFNIEAGINVSEIESAFNRHTEFFSGLDMENSMNNNNPRCLIAIEIENSGSSKHLIGDIINASILGKVGIIVTLRDNFYEKAERIFKYLEGSFTRQKLGYNPSNVVIKKYDDLLRIFSGCRRS